MLSLMTWDEAKDRQQRRRKGDDLREGPQAFQAASHSSSKAALPPKGGEQQAILGWVGLIGTVGPAKLLDGFVSGPRQLKGQVHPPLLVLGTPALRSSPSISRNYAEEGDGVWGVGEGGGGVQSQVSRSMCQ